LPSCAVCDRAWLLISDDMMSNVEYSEHAWGIYPRSVKHLTSAACVAVTAGSPACLAASARSVPVPINKVI
jgi:hypothetical protein